MPLKRIIPPVADSPVIEVLEHLGIPFSLQCPTNECNLVLHPLALANNWNKSSRRRATSPMAAIASMFSEQHYKVMLLVIIAFFFCLLPQGNAAGVRKSEYCLVRRLRRPQLTSTSAWRGQSVLPLVATFVIVTIGLTVIVTTLLILPTSSTSNIAKFRSRIISVSSLLASASRLLARECPLARISSFVPAHSNPWTTSVASSNLKVIISLSLSPSF